MRMMILAAALLATPAFAETWPEFEPKQEWVRELNARLAGPSGLFHDDTYKIYLQDYAPDGDYLNWGKLRDFRDGAVVQLDANGLPQVLQDGKPYWNTVTLSHYALVMYGRVLAGKGEWRPQFDAAIDQLVELQREDGGFPYPSRKHRHNTLPDGWVSAMAQGNALSAFVRALQFEETPEVRRAAELAFDNLMTPVEDGGSMTTMADLDPSLSGYVFFPEYPNQPVDYTLNGYMFTLLGIYDWSTVASPSQDEAKQAFADGMETLERILPYFEIDGFSTYDLGHIVLDEAPYVAPPYLGVHVYLLHALHSITGSPLLREYKTAWAAKIDAMNKPLRLTKIQVEPPRPAAGQPVKITLDAKGGDGSDELFRLAVKRDGAWRDVTKFSTAATIAWTPEEPGEYVLGLYAKNASSAEWDNFRYQVVTVSP